MTPHGCKVWHFLRSWRLFGSPNLNFEPEKTSGKSGFSYGTHRTSGLSLATTIYHHPLRVTSTDPSAPVGSGMLKQTAVGIPTCAKDKHFALADSSPTSIKPHSERSHDHPKSVTWFCDHLVLVLLATPVPSSPTATVSPPSDDWTKQVGHVVGVPFWSPIILGHQMSSVRFIGLV